MNMNNNEAPDRSTWNVVNRFEDISYQLEDRNHGGPTSLTALATGVLGTPSRPWPVVGPEGGRQQSQRTLPNSIRRDQMHSHTD